MKRWMENKIARQNAHRKLVNGMSARFAPMSKIATVCVPYSVTLKGNVPEYDGSMVRRLAPVTVAPEKIKPFDARMKSAKRRGKYRARKQLGIIGMALLTHKSESKLLPRV